MKQTKTLYCVLATLLLLASCTTEEDEYETTLYGDAAITSFTLGTLNRYVDGQKSSYAGNAYAMEIDQLAHSIENPDSLPIYTDVAHVVCSVSSLNDGYVIIKKLEEDGYVYYDSADSIDFTQPRLFRVWATDASGYTDYTVKLNVHKEDGDEWRWKLISTDVPAVDDLTPEGHTPLGRSTYEAYAWSADGKLMHKADGADTWEQDIADDHEDAASLPTGNVALVSYPMAQTDSTDYVLLAGTCGGKTVVWRKIVDYTGKKPKGQWVYMDRGSETIGLLPVLTADLSLIHYDGLVFAFGGNNSDYRTIYESRDNGITWQKSSRIQMPAKKSDENPAGFSYDNLKLMRVSTDNDNFITVRCDYQDATYATWKGRLNRLGWKK